MEIVVQVQASLLSNEAYSQVNILMIKVPFFLISYNIELIGFSGDLYLGIFLKSCNVYHVRKGRIEGGTE